MPDKIQQIFAPIIGKPCWQVQPGYGSFLTFEFGEPHLLIREPRPAPNQATEAVRRNLARRNVHVHGDWHLWVYCCDWKIIFHDEELADQSSNRAVVEEAIRELDGQALTRVLVTPSLVSVFDFDLGGRLELIPNKDRYDGYDDLWLLYEPGGFVFTLRGDGQYSHMPGDTHPEDHRWTPLGMV